MQTSPFRFLPIILVTIALGSALFFMKQQAEVTNKLNGHLNKARPQISIKLPEPTPYIPIKTLTPTPTPIPQTNSEKTPEHAVVDTALDTSIFYSLAGITYLSGLAAFVKAKRTREVPTYYRGTKRA